LHAIGDILAEDVPEPRLQQPADPVTVLTNLEPVQNVIQTYQAFDERKPGWTKVALKPVSQAAE
jgi:threonine dehydrogenase-like Zn-dependent dehydrogenase